MRNHWIVFALAAALVVGCGPSEEKKQSDKAAARQTEWVALEKDKTTLDAKRAELAALQTQLAAGVDVRAKLDATNAEVSKLTDLLTKRLADYINGDPPVQGDPLTPAQLAAVRMNSAEGILVAHEYITLGGDYRKAIDIYNQLAVADPDNPALKAALGEAQAKRFMTEARLAAVKKGMTEDEVIVAIGRPLARNVKDYPDKKITAWFFPKDEGGDAAGVFFVDKSGTKTVYKVDFAAVNARGGGGESAKD